MKSKIKIMAAALAMFLALPAIGQNLVPDENEKGKWGYIDANGEKVIDYKYDEAYGFINGIAKVRKGDKFGYINSANRPVIPIKYAEIDPLPGTNFFKVGVGKVKDGILVEGKYGYVNNTGSEIIKPEYEEITQFVGGLARVKKGNKYGFIDEQLQFVVPCEFSAVGSFNSDGVVWVNKGGKLAKGSATEITGGKYGLYDFKGNVIIPVRFGAIGSFQKWSRTYSDADFWKDINYYLKLNYKQSGSHHLISRTRVSKRMFSEMPTHDGYGYYAAAKDDQMKNNVFDPQGNPILNGGKYDVILFPQEGYARVWFKKSQDYNYLDVATGNLLLKKNLPEAYAFQDGVAVVKNPEGYCLIDKTGTPVTQCYTYIFPRNDGVYVTYNGSTYGLIDANGREILPCNNKVILSAHNNKLAVQRSEDALFGYIDTTGKYVIEPRYLDARNFILGYAYVKDNNGWGALHLDGSQAIPCQWSDIYNGHEHKARYVWVTDPADKLAHCFDVEAGKLAFPNGYTAMRTFNQDFEGVAIVWQGNDNIGLIDTTGNEIIPTDLPSVACVEEAYRQILNGEVKVWKPIHSYRVKLKFNDERNNFRLHETIITLWDY